MQWLAIATLTLDDCYFSRLVHIDIPDFSLAEFIGHTVSWLASWAIWWKFFFPWWTLLELALTWRTSSHCISKSWMLISAIAQPLPASWGCEALIFLAMACISCGNKLGAGGFLDLTKTRCDGWTWICPWSCLESWFETGKIPFCIYLAFSHFSRAFADFQVKADGPFHDSIQKVLHIESTPSCPCPGPIQKDFVIIDLSGIHTIDVQFCACHNMSGGTASHIQLLRFRCFLSTITRPQSAFTFNVLNTFHLLTLQGKVSAYEFYCMLQHKTDNTGISDMKVRFYRPWTSDPWTSDYVI